MPTPGLHYPHRIRLRDPWRSEPIAGGVRRSRRFGYPGRIDADERVWLTFGGAGGRVAVSLNGQALGTHDGGAPFEHEVTGLLGARNEVVMEVEGGGTAGRRGDGGAADGVPARGDSDGGRAGGFGWPAQ